MKPLISICIPAYRRVNYLKRLIESIGQQTYKNIEVVITDDSGEDNSVGDFIKGNSFSFDINYIKNTSSLGSPKNWLASISYASGDWIKIMHDDDYFTSTTSLQTFVNQIEPGVDCLFSGYKAVYENGGEKDMTISQRKFDQFTHQPLSLFAKNIIGPPSVMMFKKEIKETFDERLKWIVDWEYYIRLSLNYKLKYVKEALINVSYNPTQITNSCFLNPNIEIPETLMFTNKYGNKLFEIIHAYDAWWRLLRNLNIRSSIDIDKFSHNELVSDNVYKIIKFQSLFPVSVLKIGIISKCLMSISFLFNRVK